MITETKAKQKQKLQQKICLVSFSKTKRIQLALWFQPLLIIYNFVVILFSVFKYAHVCTPHVVKKNKTFFIQNSLFINAWDSRILKEKRQKKW